MNFQTRISVLAALGLTAMAALADTEAAKPAYPPYGPGMMWQQMTPEQWQQHWEYMRQQGYGPGMMGPWGGYGPSMMGPSMMGPGMMGPGMMGPWGGYGPGMMMGPGMMGPWGGYGPGMMGPQQMMTPEQYKQWYEQMQQRFNPPAKSAPSKPAK